MFFLFLISPLITVLFIHFTPTILVSFQFLTLDMACFLMPSSKIWQSLFSLPGKLTPRILLVHCLTFFNSVLKYHFAREAFPNQCIWNRDSRDPSLTFLSLTIYHLLTYLSAYCVSPSVTLFSSPLGTPHHLTDLCVYIWVVWLCWDMTGAVLFM